MTPSPTLILNHLALSANGPEKAGIVGAIPQRARRRWACDSGDCAQISHIKFFAQKAKTFLAGSPCWHNWPPMETKVLMACTRMATALAPKEAWESKLALRPSHALWLKVSVVAALVGFLFFAVLADMAHDWWTEPALSQGMLLPPVALYFAWVHRKRTFGQAATPDARGLALTALARSEEHTSELQS